ncbi:polysaccharide deacetylase family protein [Methylocystis bryophila]|uniref:Chitooligosaccharide deacetylase n=1 Tax=Methylocystis bryophila TaxID=655015 RepID=A0A1W6MV52_9HYPH|nr:polysaccharide deacetylase family protein [Methylocystis bryophila]ARN81493.1 hypothetical protein B1812_10890 [Methylocystis bryophila]BDV37513.1 hypothetical protein DSM21852_07660 [Methylocystis bryophila]
MDKAAPPLELVLSLHGIGTGPPRASADELRYWLSVDRFVECLSLAKAFTSRTGITVLATFDDGNRSDLLVAAPLLRQYGVPGAFFVCAGRMGQPNYLDADDVRELVKQGFVVGSHGMDHVRWTSVKGPGLHREIVEARLKLEETLDQEIPIAALPFGAYNRRVLAALRDAGFLSVFCSDPGVSPPGAWLRRRWTLRCSERFDFDKMLLRSGALSHRASVTMKAMLKAWR